jgi:hypothetical protein
LDRDVAEAFDRDGVLSAPKDVAEAANDNDELRIAARMASALPQEQIRQIITLVGSFEKRAAQPLDDLGAQVRATITKSFAARRPFEQAEAAANFVRSHLNLTTEDWIDVFDVVKTLGVSLHSQHVEPSTVFALAVWGPRHGPAVLLNELAMQHPPQIQLRENWVARVNLAHELCHLLLDHEHTLTAIEVLQSRMPLDIERRAKAFAGEFLLPASRAADLWEKAKSPRSLIELDEFVGKLCRDYGVTKNVAAWKLEHGLHKKDVDLRVLLTRSRLTDMHMNDVVGMIDANAAEVPAIRALIKSGLRFQTERLPDSNDRGDDDARSGRLELPVIRGRRCRPRVLLLSPRLEEWFSPGQQGMTMTTNDIREQMATTSSS